MYPPMTGSAMTASPLISGQCLALKVGFRNFKRPLRASASDWVGRFRQFDDLTS